MRNNRCLLKINTEFCIVTKVQSEMFSDSSAEALHLLSDIQDKNKDNILSESYPFCLSPSHQQKKFQKTELLGHDS